MYFFLLRHPLSIECCFSVVDLQLCLTWCSIYKSGLKDSVPSQRTIVLQMPTRRYLPPHLRNQCTAKRAQDTLCALMLVQSHNCGPRNLSCTFCGALRWADECNSICCFTVKVKLPDYPDPPSPVRAILLEGSQRSNVFRKYIRQLNNSLSLASVKIGSNSNVDGYNPTVFCRLLFIFFLRSSKGFSNTFSRESVTNCLVLLNRVTTILNTPRYMFLIPCVNESLIG